MSAAAFVVVVAWWKLGTVPNAELQGLLALFAVGLSIPATAFSLGALHCARLAFGRLPRESTWSTGLGSVETALGLGLGLVAVRGGVADYYNASRSFGQPTTPLSYMWGLAQPLVLPLLLLSLGVTTLCVSLRRSRTARTSLPA